MNKEIQDTSSDVLKLAKECNFWEPMGLPSDWYDHDLIASPEQLGAFYRAAKEEGFRQGFNKAIEDAANPQTIKQLIARQRELAALCKLQHEVLKKYQQRQSMDDLESAGYAAYSAIAAYEQFGGEA